MKHEVTMVTQAKSIIWRYSAPNFSRELDFETKLCAMRMGYYGSCKEGAAMISWLDKLGGKPDHPMFNTDEAKRLLLDLPKHDPFKALDEMTSWLTSFAGTPGYRLHDRIGVAMLLDEKSQTFYAELMRQYIASPHLQDFQSLSLWRGMQAFLKAAAETYAVCIHEYQQEEKRSAEINEEMPVILVRLLRALAEQMKLALMRYMDIAEDVWRDLYQYYRFAEERQFAETMVFAYAGHVIHTSPQRELLRALVLYESSPGTLAPNQIEVTYRIAARMASFFDLKPVRDADCNWFFDLARPAAPAWVNDKLEGTESLRFFGAIRAVPKLEDITHQHHHDIIDKDRRFGNEFTPDGKLTVLKHLQLFWSKEHLHRLQERRGIHVDIEVVHGFKTISNLVDHLKLDQIDNLSGEDAARLKERTDIGLAGVEVGHVSESWAVLDVSTTGIGGIVPRTADCWAKVGALCGLKGKGASLWWVGMIRRLKTDNQNKVHVGIEILTKKPMSVWLRTLGKGKERVSHWATSSGSFAYDYQPVILLPDEHDTYANPTMLMESDRYVLDTIYEVMLGEKSRNLKLTGLLTEGDDYEHVSFQWLDTED